LSFRQLLEEHEIKIKDHTSTSLDTKGSMIAKVAMTKNKMFLLNIEIYVPKCLDTCVNDEIWL